MRESVEFIELTYLKKAGRDCWLFQTKYNESFERVFESMCQAHVFNAVKTHLLVAGLHYEINDQGIWLLSHVFSNWDEMFEKATGKRAEHKICDYCDLIITSDQLSALFCKECQKDFHYSCYYEHIDQKPPTEQGEPEQKQEKEWPRQCAHCSASIGSQTAFTCKTCQKKICVNCSVQRCTEQKKQANQRACADCKKTIYNGIPAPFCVMCGESICADCWQSHTARHEQKKKQKEYQQTCAQCKREYGLAYAWVYCSQCKQQFCLKCSAFHQETHTYDRRREYGFAGGTFSWDPAREEDLEKYYRLYQAGILSEEEFKARAFGQKSKQQAEEEAARQHTKEQEEERIKEQARQNESFWRNFWGNDDDSYTFRQHYANTGQQSRSNGYYGFDKQSTPGISKDLQDAFKLLNLSTRATVQEVKRAFRKQAKQGDYRHPDAGGSKEKFVMLNNAYELALSHAQKNEVK